jgi:hypothetical protein
MLTANPTLALGGAVLTPSRPAFFTPAIAFARSQSQAGAHRDTRTSLR